MADRDRPPAYAIARLSVDVLIPVPADASERRIGGRLYTATGSVCWDADSVLGYLMGVQSAMDESGHESTIIRGSIDRIVFVAESAPIEQLDYQKHVAEEARDAD